jgi:MFS family permease
MKKGNVRKLLGILSCAFLYSSMYLLPYIKYIFYDAVVDATGFTNTQIGFTLTVYIAAAIISTIPSGWLADKFDPKKLLTISGIGHVLASTLALIFIRSYVMTLICFFIMGITSTLAFWSPVFKAVSLVGSKDEQGKWYGWFEGFNGIGSMVFNFGALYVFGKVTGGSVAALKSVYIFYICSSLVATLMVLFLYKPSEEAVANEAENKPAVKKKATNKEIFAVLKMPRVWLFSLMVFGIYGFYCGSSYLTPYFSTVLGVSVVFSGSLATLKNYGTRLVGAPIAGHICDKIGCLKFLTFAGAATIVLMIAFMMMPESQSALVPIMILMFALALVNVSMKGVQFSALNEVGVDQSVNGMAIGLASLIGFNIPDLVLHPVFGAILDKYEPTAAYKIIFGCLLGLLTMAFVVGLILLLITKKEKTVENVKPQE